LPVVTTLMGLGALDTTDPLALHMLGMHGTAYANYAVEDCDFLLALGARFDDRVAGVPAKFAPRARSSSRRSTSTRPRSARSSRAVASRAADGAYAGALTEYGIAHGKRRLDAWHTHIAELKRMHAMNYDRDSELIQPYA
jgi:acetolactate synthase-1/2/3 large subunit